MKLAGCLAKIMPRRLWTSLFILFLLLFLTVQNITSQSIDRDRERGRVMLEVLKEDLKKNYYDINFRNIDLDKRFAAAEVKMKTAESLGQVFGIVAQLLMDFEDSHLFFIPPNRKTRYDFGLKIEMVGDKCMVKDVNPDSDAQIKGLKPGDLVLSFGGYPPNRDILWNILYAYYVLRPQPTLSLVIQSPGSRRRDVTIAAEMKQIPDTTGNLNLDRDYDIREWQTLQHLYRVRTAEFGKSLVICKMPTFQITEQKVDDLMRNLRKFDAVILDLRGNGGGSVLALQRLAGYFFDHEVKIADLKGRKDLKPMTARGPADRIYKGKLIVLVDSESASASELFARLIQIERRGEVIGDRTAGAVMEAIHYNHWDSRVQFTVSITNADLYMSDGKSLEKTGVTPDELILPTQEDLAAQRDPVLTRAAALAGVRLDSAKAGALFPTEWPKL